MSGEAIGLDVGGANLKAATAAGQAASHPFELWRHPDRLADELSHFRNLWPDVRTVAVTMTGELCDCFPTKRDGVRHILAAARDAFGDARLSVWTVLGLLSWDDARERDPLLAAAANWLALATFAGRLAPAGVGLLIDTGSTTTDVIPLRNGQPVPVGLTDSGRLWSGELVYTGVRRTPVCALLQDGVAAEWFATAHDVYVRLGTLPAEPENGGTADGRPMTLELAHARLSRMLGGDPEVTPEEDTLLLAEQAFSRQRALIRAGIERVHGRLADAPRTVFLSGSGEFLARAAWDEFAAERGLRSVRTVSLSDALGPAVSEAACAYALAVLAAEAG